MSYGNLQSMKCYTIESRVSASNFNLKKKNDIISGYGKRKHENEKKANTS